MSSYGRNFDFRVPPQPDHRGSRYVTATELPIGVPVAVTATTQDAQGRNPVVLATGATTKKEGLTGILVFEYAPAAFAGVDPALTTYSDLGTAPAGSPVQLVSGESVKVVLRNTSARSFYGQRTYAGRVMVAGLGATPTVAVGDYLRPGVGDDTSGYWTETSTESEAWLVVTGVDTVRQEVEARMTF